MSQILNSASKKVTDLPVGPQIILFRPLQNCGKPLKVFFHASAYYNNVVQFMALSQMVGAEATAYGKRWYWYKPWVVLMVREGLDYYKIACVGTQLHGVSFKGT